MTSPWLDQLKADIATALKSALRLQDSPRRGLLVRALRGCTEAAERPSPDPAALAETLRSAMSPAMVLATDDPEALEIAAALGAAFNKVLAPLRPRRLESAAPPLLKDCLTSVTRDAPRTVSIARDLFTPPPEPDEEEALGDLDLEEIFDSGELDSPEDIIAPQEDAPPAERPPHEDWRPLEGAAPEPPPVSLLEERKTLDVAGFHAATIDQCLETIGALARDRVHDPFSNRLVAEQRILAATDAILAVGGGCVATVVAWWARAIESPSPWCSWAAPFALGCIEGADALLAVRHGLEQLAPGAVAHAEQAAEALAITPHAARLTLGIDLVGSPHPVARAVGVDILARAGRLTVDELRPHIFDANLPVMISALRAIGRLPAADGARLVPLLERWMHFPDPAVAWLAAKALICWGDTRPYDDLRNRGRLASILGGRAVELFVLAGSDLDLAPLQALVSRAARTPAILSALGRFGHPGAAPFLLHYLADEDLGEHAADALISLFGPRVEPDALLSAVAWRAAIVALKLDPGARCRRGVAWTPSGVVADCSSGELSRAQIEPRLDELAARVRIDVPVDLGLWTPETRPMFLGLSAAARACDGAWPASGWS